MNKPQVDEDALAEAIAANLDIDDPEAMEKAQLMAEIMGWVLDGQDTPADPAETTTPVKALAPRRPRRARKAAQAELKPAKSKRKEAG